MPAFGLPQSGAIALNPPPFVESTDAEERLYRSGDLARLVLIAGRAHENFSPLSHCRLRHHSEWMFHEPSSSAGARLSPLCCETYARAAEANGPRSKGRQSSVEAKTEELAARAAPNDNKFRGRFGAVVG